MPNFIKLLFGLAYQYLQNATICFLLTQSTNEKGVLRQTVSCWKHYIKACNYLLAVQYYSGQREVFPSHLYNLLDFNMHFFESQYVYFENYFDIIGNNKQIA